MTLLHTTRWGAIRFADKGTAFCPVTAWCYEKTGRIFQVWQFYDAGKLLGWAEIRSLAIAILADMAFIPFRRRFLRRLVPELFAADSI